MPDVDATGVRPRKVAYELFVARRGLVRIPAEYVEENLGLRPKTGGCELAGVPTCLGREDYLSPHQPGPLEHLLTGVFMPLRMDSRMPGTESRYNVSCTARQSSSETSTALPRLPVI